MSNETSAEAGVATEPTRPPHSENADELLARLGVDPSRGLSTEEVRARLARYGENRMPEAPRKSRILRLLGQFETWHIDHRLSSPIRRAKILL